MTGPFFTCSGYPDPTFFNVSDGRWTGFFIGGELPGFGSDGTAANSGWGEGEWVVVEADDLVWVGFRPDRLEELLR